MNKSLSGLRLTRFSAILSHLCLSLRQRTLRIDLSTSLIKGEETMANLKAAHQELFRRQDDECFETLEELIRHCRTEREAGSELWHPPDILWPQIDGDRLRLHMGDDGAFLMNHWSFSQMCGLCGVSRDTINCLSPGEHGLRSQETGS